ncbi:MAG: hypothetical protein KAJ51_05070, partial [Thermoplasmata archaeon]|nr:hypothetical protein [Thermoplasmata archaeon]
MKKLICTILIFILILSGITIIIEPANSKILNSDTISKSKEFELARLEEPNILKNFNRIDGYFTKNQGQINEDSVKYYIQGKCVWFLDDGVV